MADLHLGLGLDRTSTSTASQVAAQMSRELITTAAGRGAKRIVIAGDSKHPIVGVPALLRPLLFEFFAELLEAGFRVDAILGNHDVGLVPGLPREVKVFPPSGMVIDDVGIFHGHCWPSKQVLSASQLVVGHLHPGYRFAPTADEEAPKRRCWVRAELDPAALDPSARDRYPIRSRRIVVLPAFHPLAGTEALNKESPARGRSFLFQRFLSRGNCRAYLLDGTDLGRLELSGPSPVRPNATTGRSSRPPSRARDTGSRSK